MLIERAGTGNADDRHRNLRVEILTRRTFLRHRNLFATGLQYNNESFNARFFKNRFFNNKFKTIKRKYSLRTQNRYNRTNKLID